MSDIQHKTSQKSYRIAEADYSPDIPTGTIEMFNRKFKEWEARRGIASKSTFFTTKRGIALRAERAKQNKIANTTKSKKKR